MAKILVVDDEEMMLMITKRVLSANYEIVCAHSGEEALNMYESEKPDLILSDLMMPGMTGFEMHEFLQKKHNEKIPIMYMTADESEENEDKGFDLGASDFIRKPFRPDVLMRRVDNILGNLEQIKGLKEEAVIDKLTGFLNKAGSNMELEKCCKNEKGTLMIVDLDSFKLINDIYGHESGDRILENFASIITDNSRNDDIRGRIGGDEFIVFLKDICDEQTIAGFASRINERIHKIAVDLFGEDMDIPLGASVGAVKIPEFGTDYEELFKLADKALYFVKQNGKHGYSFYQDEESFASEGSGNEISRISKILEERNTTNSALWLGQEAFASIYRFMLRYIKTYHEVAYKVLFTVVPMDEKTESSKLKEAADYFGDMLNHALRKSDIMMQSRPNQFFLLLPELSEQSIDPVMSRIIGQWLDSDYASFAKLSYETELINEYEVDTENDRRSSHLTI